MTRHRTSTTRPAVRNPFLASARGRHRGRSASLGERDGFHTASTFDLTVPYANLKGSPYTNHPEESVWWGDYPVVLTLDMTGLDRVPDVDAERAAGVAFDYFAGAIQLIELTKSPHHQGFTDEVLADVRRALDHDDLLEEEPLGAGAATQDALWQLSGSPSTGYGAALAFRNWVLNLSDGDLQRLLRAYDETKNPNMFKASLTMAFARPGEVVSDVLCEIFGQQKYLEDVDSGRLIAVDYVMPYFDFVLNDSDPVSDVRSALLDVGYPDDDEVLQGLADEWFDDVVAAGFRTLTEDDVSRGNLDVGHRQVWERHAAQFDLPLGAEHEHRIEFHGTSYQNLLAAVPELADVLPVPPKPAGMSWRDITGLSDVTAWAAARTKRAIAAAKKQANPAKSAKPAKRGHR